MHLHQVIPQYLEIARKIHKRASRERVIIELEHLKFKNTNSFILGKIYQKRPKKTEVIGVYFFFFFFFFPQSEPPYIIFIEVSKFKVH